MLNLTDILTRAKSLKIAVIGDLIEDIYIYGSVNRISPEAPVPVVEYHETKRTMGGAGNVYRNLLNLCPKTELYCFFEKEFREPGYIFWPTENVHRHVASHSKKTRIVSGQQQMLRVDDDVVPNPPYNFEEVSWRQDLGYSIMSGYDAVVYSDYNKGVLTPQLIDCVTLAANYNKTPIIVDAKDRYSRFRNSSIVKGNMKEWGAYDLHGERYCEAYNVDNVVVTCGGRGISYYDKREGSGIDGIECPIVDVCGAGDTVTAILAIMKALGEPIHDACELANIAAAEVCKYSGVTPIDEEKLIKAYESYRAHSS